MHSMTRCKKKEIEKKKKHNIVPCTMGNQRLSFQERVAIWFKRVLKYFWIES
jgi:hypothetical protein